MARIYLESSFVSYLTAAPRVGRDPITAAHQQLTIEWWSRRRTDFDLVVSQVVLDEVQMGDPTFAKSRLEVVSSLPRLLVTDEATTLPATFYPKVFCLRRLSPMHSTSRSPRLTRSNTFSRGTASTSPTWRFYPASQISARS